MAAENRLQGSLLSPERLTAASAVNSAIGNECFLARDDLCGYCGGSYSLSHPNREQLGARALATHTEQFFSTAFPLEILLPTPLSMLSLRRRA